MREILQEVAEKYYNVAPNSTKIYWVPYGVVNLIIQVNSPNKIDDQPLPVAELKCATKEYHLSPIIVPSENVRLISAFDSEDRRIFIAEHSKVDDMTITYPPARLLSDTTRWILD